jgi:hypothetical protein
MIIFVYSGLKLEPLVIFFSTIFFFPVSIDCPQIARVSLSTASPTLSLQPHPPSVLSTAAPTLPRSLRSAHQPLGPGTRVFLSFSRDAHLRQWCLAFYRWLLRYSVVQLSFLRTYSPVMSYTSVMYAICTSISRPVWCNDWIYYHLPMLVNCSAYTIKKDLWCLLVIYLWCRLAKPIYEI